MTRLLVLCLVLLGALDGISLSRNAVRKTTLVAQAAGGSCNACRMHEDLRALSLQAIKEQILSKLGLKQAPNMTGRPLPKIPPISRLMDLYGIQSDQPVDQVEPGLTRHEEVDEYAAKTENVIALAQPHPRLRHAKGNLDVLYFKFSDKIVQHRVREAKLSLWVWGSDHESPDREVLRSGFQQESARGPITVTLQRILRGSSENGGPLLGPQLTTKHPRPERNGDWIVIDVKRMVAMWFKHPRDNLGVAIKLQAGSNGHRRSNFKLMELDPDAEHTPYLDVEIEDLDSRRSGRVKRTVGLNCDEASQESRCCRYKLTVDFEKFGWDWIIAPKRYDANYCSGDCPMAFLTEYPNTHIVSLAEPPHNSGPCCTARRMSQISMLYFDSEYQIVFTKIPGMVVERCGCS
ncbi:growth/differentiation factor 8-like [Diprion similis]|uniref:growth/differentiation factor 8-like n=1 Tax=Diprion similis TaxID=362088 RepID=UPI001EF76AEB|nr:growth/differentiation factor 8-like [Diprion similis]XP_046747386.1 growth/differentiation factor 8-like [Diprion similis]